MRKIVFHCLCYVLLLSFSMAGLSWLRLLRLACPKIGEGEHDTSSNLKSCQANKWESIYAHLTI